MYAAAIAPVPVSTALAAFDRWAAERVLAPAEFVLGADKLPITPAEPGRYEPTVAEAWEVVGFDLGRAGELVDVLDAFPAASPRDLIVAAYGYSQGQHEGFTRHARNLGFEAGLEGETDIPPASIPGRFHLAFQLGHSEGIQERRERGESMDGYFRLLADEHEEHVWQQELEHLAREAGGWDRFANRELI